MSDSHPPQKTPFWSSKDREKLKKDDRASTAWKGVLPSVSSLGALLAKDLPPAVPVVAPWLHLGESCMLWGGTGTGKSMIAQTIALAAAGGGEVFGWTFPNPGKVLYVDGEQSERGIQGRFKLLQTGVANIDAAKAAQNLTVMARTAQDEGAGFLDMASPEQAEMFAAAVGRQKTSLVVFDNLSTLSDRIEDENSAAAFKPMQTLLTRLKKLNVAVILVHHAGKDPANGYRGSSGIATTFERILGIVRSEAAPSTRIDVVAQLEKFRDEVPAGFQPTFPLKFETVGEGTARRAVWTVGQLAKLEEAWRMFWAGSYRTKGELVEAFNARFGENHKAGNFARDFASRFMTELGKTPQEIRRAEERMKVMRGGRADAEDLEAPMDY